ncbi:hypothetical protein GLOTRDRAFT_61337, partial [Gloeophyllum trabeum ATCC 11539]
MPPGSPYNSFVVPYSIRVDEFTSSPSISTVPALHLLSHTHSDHIVGLSAKSFASIVVCSADAKEMLLRHEVYYERSLRDNEFRSESVRTFKHLKVDPVVSQDGQVYYQGSRDLLQSAVSGLVELIALFLPTTLFFINSWTWGYEDILKGIAAVFECQIHVDRYKHSVYKNLSDPFMRDIITTKAESTRFHACERFDRCKYVPDVRIEPNENARKVVCINPVTMSSSAWHRYLEETRRELEQGHEMTSLLVPLSRHSALPELLQFVNVFKPRRVVPNTLMPALGGLDWLCIEKM